MQSDIHYWPQSDTLLKTLELSVGSSQSQGKISVALSSEIISSAFALPLYFIIDESVQWLLGKRRIEDAEKIVLKAAKGNKKTLEQPIFTDDKDKKEDEDEKKKGQCASFMEMFVDIGKDRF